VGTRGNIPYKVQIYKYSKQQRIFFGGEIPLEACKVRLRCSVHVLHNYKYNVLII